MNWKAKAVVQKTLSMLPGGTSCNYLLQRTLGQLRSDSFVHTAFEQDVTVLFERMARLGLEPAKSRILEIGTGWVPTFSLCLGLAGFRNTYTLDLQVHLHETAVRRTLMALREHLEHPVFQLFATQEQVYANFDRLVRCASILPAAGITDMAP